jgi:hypothetical protein
LYEETKLDPKSTNCRVESESADLPGVRQLLFEGPIQTAIHDGTVGQQVSFTLDAMLDAYERNGHIVVDPSRRVSPASAPDTYLDTQGRLILTPTAPTPWHANEILGFEFQADGELALGITVVSQGREFFRYYPRSFPGSHALILLNPLGFDHGEDISNIERLVVYFYTDKQEQIVRVQPKLLLLFHNQQQLYQYFKEVGTEFHGRSQHLAWRTHFGTSVAHSFWNMLCWLQQLGLKEHKPE